MTHHKLIHAASERVLSDTKTLLEENVQDEGKGASRAGGGQRCSALSEDVPSGAEQGDASVTQFHFPLLRESVRPGIKQQTLRLSEQRASEKPN